MTQDRGQQPLTPQQRRRRQEVLERARADASLMQQVRESAEYFAGGGEPIPWEDFVQRSRGDRGE